MFRTAIDAAMLPLLKEWLLHVMKRLASSSTSPDRLIWNFTVLIVGISTDSCLAETYPFLIVMKSCPYSMDLCNCLTSALTDFLKGTEIEKRQSLITILQVCKDKFDIFDEIYKNVLDQ